MTWPKLSLESLYRYPKALLSMVIVLLMILASTAITDLAIWHKVRECGDAELSRSNRRTVSDIYTYMLESHVAERGYLFTGSVLDAGEYYVAVQKTLVAEQTLNKASLTAAQREYLDDFIVSTNNFLDFLDLCINTYNKKGPVAAGDLVRTHRGYRELQHIREVKNLLWNSLLSTKN